MACHQVVTVKVAIILADDEQGEDVDMDEADADEIEVAQQRSC